MEEASTNSFYSVDHHREFCGSTPYNDIDGENENQENKYMDDRDDHCDIRAVHSKSRNRGNNTYIYHSVDRSSMFDPPSKVCGGAIFSKLMPMSNPTMSNDGTTKNTNSNNKEGKKKNKYKKNKKKSLFHTKIFRSSMTKVLSSHVTSSSSSATDSIQELNRINSSSSSSNINRCRDSSNMTMEKGSEGKDEDEGRDEAEAEAEDEDTENVIKPSMSGNGIIGIQRLTYSTTSMSSLEEMNYLLKLNQEKTFTSDGDDDDKNNNDDIIVGRQEKKKEKDGGNTYNANNTANNNRHLLESNNQASLEEMHILLRNLKAIDTNVKNDSKPIDGQLSLEVTDIGRKLSPMANKNNSNNNAVLSSSSDRNEEDIIKSPCEDDDDDDDDDDNDDANNKEEKGKQHVAKIKEENNAFHYLKRIPTTTARYGSCDKNNEVIAHKVIRNTTTERKHYRREANDLRVEVDTIKKELDQIRKFLPGIHVINSRERTSTCTGVRDNNDDDNNDNVQGDKNGTTYVKNDSVSEESCCQRNIVRDQKHSTGSKNIIDNEDDKVNNGTEDIRGQSQPVLTGEEETIPTNAHRGENYDESNHKQRKIPNAAIQIRPPQDAMIDSCKDRPEMSKKQHGVCSLSTFPLHSNKDRGNSMLLTESSVKKDSSCENKESVSNRSECKAPSRFRSFFYNQDEHLSAETFDFKNAPSVFSK